MVKGIHTGRGAFLKNYVASRPPVVKRMAHHRFVLEEPEPTQDLAESLQAVGPNNKPLVFRGPEFDFDDLH